LYFVQKIIWVFNSSYYGDFRDKPETRRFRAATTSYLYLSAVTMLALRSPPNLEPQQRWMILPVVFTVFLLSFPAGLFMYWITSNLVTLIQNY